MSNVKESPRPAAPKASEDSALIARWMEAFNIERALHNARSRA